MGRKKKGKKKRLKGRGEWRVSFGHVTFKMVVIIQIETSSRKMAVGVWVSEESSGLSKVGRRNKTNGINEIAHGKSLERGHNEALNWALRSNLTLTHRGQVFVLNTLIYSKGFYKRWEICTKISQEKYVYYKSKKPETIYLSKLENNWVNYKRPYDIF